MNKQERKVITELRDRVEACRDELDGHKDSEWEKFDNMPKGLQQSENGQRMETIADALERAYDALGEAFDAIGEALDA